MGMPLSKPFALEKYARLDSFLSELKRDAAPALTPELEESLCLMMYERLCSTFQLPAGARVLDTACGRGTALSLFQNAGLRAVGIGSPQDVAHCRRLGFDAREMDPSFLDFEPESFDLVWCPRVLNRSAMPLFTLTELFRVLRPGGILYLEMHASDTACGQEAHPNHTSVFGKRMWLELIRRAGFETPKALDLAIPTAAGADTLWTFLQRRPMAKPVQPAASPGDTTMPATCPAATTAKAPMPQAAQPKSGERVLVCMLGQLRAHELTWQNFKENVLDELNADLAVCIGTDERFDTTNPFFVNARHRWTVPEFADYGDGFELARDVLGGADDWRTLLSVGNQWLGGIKGDNSQPGSGSIQIFFRWLLLHHLRKDGLIAQYDRFIITRSDFFYFSPHPPIDVLDRDALWIPNGEDYGGFTDRHLVVSANDLEPALSLIDDIVVRPKALLTEMRRYNQWNIERYLRFQFTKRGLARRVRRFPYVMFTVRGTNDPSSWSWGRFDPDTGMIVKYPGEKHEAMKYRELIKNKDDWRSYFDNLANAKPLAHAGE
ncbi:MAG: class I SAM-dependent methyltransferase [Defluviicoccus sp.]|nr:class I SAM-dependent methyltransferase [Defluviicoccus sp.]MDG4608207.1 class I SAM-dependent methyltransferase [Defluviicoccus sp.]